MARFFTIHSDTPQVRLIRQAVDILRQGGVIAYPTDSCYALGCRIGDKVALERIRHLRGIKTPHYMSLICRNLSELTAYAVVDNASFRMMKAITPGPYTFILKAGRGLPRRLQDPKRKAVGLRIPDNAISLALSSALGEPLISSSLLLPDEDLPEVDAKEIERKIGKRLDLIIDGGIGGFDFTTVLDMTGRYPTIIREGKGMQEPILGTL